MPDPRWHPDGLYLHVPFCEAICSYCDFAREIRQAPRVAGYLSALETELEQKVRALSSTGGFRPRTVFIGGGTPSSLSVDELSALLGILERHVDFGALEEFTVEANPNSIDAPKLELLRGHRMDRISFGVQSFQPHILGMLGRIHDAEDGCHAVRLARSVGFERISIDLIHGVPTQTTDDLKRDMDNALALDLEHLSAYGLTYEEGTPLRKALFDNTVKRLCEEEEAAQFGLVMDYLEAAGLTQYEISNYAKPGQEARHNLLYWRNEAYAGVGPSAAHYVKGERSVNLRDVGAYIRALEKNADYVESREVLSDERRARESLVLELRMRRGVEPAAFFERWGLDIEEEFGEVLTNFESNGLMERIEEDRWRISRNGLSVANGILSEFV